MNSIAGVVYPDVFQMNDLVSPMFQSTKHRCPQNPTIYTYKNIQIGGCGTPAAQNKSKTLFCVIDGTINNAKELAADLKIKTLEASEIVLKAYVTYGLSVFEKIRGEFAIAILDQTKKQIILGRDSIGKRPLYWFQNQHHFIFGSELKSLLSTGAVPQTPAIDSLAHYLYFGYIPQDMSPIQGVSKLLPAHYLQFHFDGSIAINSYWSYSSFFEKTAKSSDQQIIENIDHLISKSITQALPEETEQVACLISGGLGSASIASYLHNLVPEGKLTAYSIGFQGEDDSDIYATRTIAKTLSIPHERYSITQQPFIDDLVKINWFLDEPIADPHTISTWKIAEIVSEKSKTIYSGMGSDELFAIHSRYTTQAQNSNYLTKLTQPVIQELRKALIPFTQWIYKPLAYQLIKESRTNPWQFNYLRDNAVFSEYELAKASPKLSGIFDPEVFLHKFHRLDRVPSTVSSFLYFDVKTRLADCFVHQFERLTTAHHVHWKAPFLYRDLVEYLATLPEPDFINEKQAGSYLKLLMQDTFPPSILERPKRTRERFLKRWMESDQIMSLFMLLPKGTLVDNGLISKNWLIDQINLVGSSNYAYRYLWSVLQLEIWFRLFINRPIDPIPPQISAFELLSEPS
jgi:asparagine synthase (glutamine-hydrolysing)